MYLIVWYGVVGGYGKAVACTALDPGVRCGVVGGDGQAVTCTVRDSGVRCGVLVDHI